MAADDGFPRFKKLDFDAAFGAKNDGWKIELGAKDFQRKIDDLPSDLELGVDSENRYRIWHQALLKLFYRWQESGALRLI